MSEFAGFSLRVKKLEVSMRFLTAVILMLTPMAAVADALCDELWLTRNTVFDRAGYCFGSDLGAAIFDNSDCTTSSPKLDTEGEMIVAQIREVETEFSCKVDTSRSALDVNHVDQRRALYDLPVRTGYESACIGYTGPALLLTAGRHPDTSIFGEIMPGDDVYFGYITMDGMDFIDLGDGQFGWLSNHLITPAVCTSMAG
jgi:hypothetical protein